MAAIKDRLSQFIEYEKISNAELERTANISNGVTTKPNVGLSKKTIGLICNAYPQLNREWLETGSGEMLNPTSPKPLIDIKDVEDSFNDSNVLDKFLEIIREKDKQIEELNQRIAQLTDKLLGL
ncbi:MAG: hypothetical protein HFJ91_00805 [Muribaculaceae bacterium]|nr:hypothetical protein [Muribaculaceae bacterium]